MPERRRYERTPDTIAMLSATALAASVLTLTGKSPSSVRDLVPPAVAVSWSALLAAAAIVTLAGILNSQPLRGWVLELGGRIGLTALLTAYTFAMGRDAHLGSLLVAAFIAGAAVSSAWRTRQIWRRLRQWQEAAREAQL